MTTCITLSLMTLMMLATTGCGGTSFSGGAGKAKDESAIEPKKSNDAKKAKEENSRELTEDSDADKNASDDEEDEPSKIEALEQSTPEDPIDIQDEGFACIDDMSAADGPWEGTFEGSGLSFTPGNSGVLDVTGTVNFSMEFIGKDELGITDFDIKGGMQGKDQIVSYEPSMELRCGDGSFQPTKVNHAGHVLTVTLTFTHQSWNPPMLKGTWAATDILPWASGTWETRVK